MRARPHDQQILVILQPQVSRHALEHDIVSFDYVSSGNPVAKALRIER